MLVETSLSSSEPPSELCPVQADAWKRVKVAPPKKPLAALLIAGLCVPHLQAAPSASQQRHEKTQAVLSSLEESYEKLTEVNPRLRSVSLARPTLLAMLFLDQAAERLGPSTWASLPDAPEPSELHKTLLAQGNFVSFLDSACSSSASTLPPSQMVRVYSSILVASRVFHVPPNVFLCLLLQESNFALDTVSHKGAKGVGQLTDIGVQQVSEILEQSSRWRERLKEYETTLASLYSDPLTKDVLRALLPQVRMPSFKSIGQIDTKSVFIPEANIALSAILFRYYMRYPWKVGSRRLLLPFSFRSALAVIAYNHGQAGALKLLKRMDQKGIFAQDELNIEQLMRLCSREFIAEALGNSPGMNPTELYHHFISVMTCARSVNAEGLFNLKDPKARALASKS